MCGATEGKRSRQRANGEQRRHRPFAASLGENANQEIARYVLRIVVQDSGPVSSFSAMTREDGNQQDQGYGNA